MSTYIEHLGATATVDLTLTEYTQLTGASGTAYVFLLTHVTSGATCVFHAPDTSSHPFRYNRFSLRSVGSTAQDLQAGKFYLPEPGTCDYYVYSTNATVPVSLDLANTLELVETGRLHLTGATSSIPSWSPSSGTIPEWES